MKVTLAQREQPIRSYRFDYQFRWFSWALPLHVGIGTSFFPGNDATFHLDERWEVQRVLIVDVLCFRMLAVLTGRLFEDFAEDEE